MPIAELTDRVGALMGTLKAAGANMDSAHPRAAVDSALELLSERDVVAVSGEVVRVRQRFVLRYYSRQIAHLLQPPPG
jgi:C4-dicarboxylate-specific signal transduction histidine kinase